MNTKTIPNERAPLAVHGAAAYIRRGHAVLANMTDAEKAAAARREEIRAIRADAKKRIDAIQAAA